ncbi:MAG: hypothetical protein RLZZ584_656 [Pseudomonadota bacterium]
MHPDYCAIDFGTSNSAIAVPGAGAHAPGAGMQLVELEAGQPTMPTAVFYLAEGPGLQHPGGDYPRLYGRAAIAAYVDGHEGRLMRSMKSVLGSSLMDQRTDIGAGRAVSFADVIASYLRQLKRSAETARGGAPLTRVVLGRPVYFVDDDPTRDAAAQAALEAAARSVGYTEIGFQYEPIAAALHHEATLVREELVLVADIGGGTSDFSLVRVGPAQRERLDRQADVLANHGIHVAGTDFDRRVALATVMRELGLGSHGRPGQGQPAREVPSKVYHDLATWHLINTVYRPARVAEVRAMRVNFADERLWRRLLRVVDAHLGHDLAGRAEAAKIAVAAGQATTVDLGLVEPGLALTLQAAPTLGALAGDIERIVAAATETVRRAGLAPAAVDAVYFTGGSTGLVTLTAALAAAFPAARPVHGERLASVATGLALYARRLFQA